MKKHLFCLLLALLLALILTGCFHDEEAERTPDVDFYIQYAAERFGIPSEDISVVQFQEGTCVRHGVFGEKRLLWEPVIRLELDGKIVSFSYYSTEDYYDIAYLKDDYYFDELYQGVREYCIQNLDLDDVIVAPDDRGRHTSSLPGAALCYGYNTYLTEHDITEVNDSVIEDFIEHMGPATVLYIDLKEWNGEALKGEELETEIKALIDRMRQINCKSTVQVMQSLSEIGVYRLPINEDFKYRDERPLCVEPNGLNGRLCRIEPEEGQCRTDYQGYSYTIIDQEEEQKEIFEN